MKQAYREKYISEKEREERSRKNRRRCISILGNDHVRYSGTADLFLLSSSLFTLL